VKQNSARGIWNNPNQWSEDHRYVIELIKRVVRVSVETVLTVAGLPKVFETETNEHLASHQTPVEDD